MRQSIKTNGCLSEFELVDIPDGMFGRGGCVLQQFRIRDIVELKAINGNTVDTRRLSEETPWGEFNFCAGKSAGMSAVLCVNELSRRYAENKFWQTLQFHIARKFRSQPKM